MSVFLGLLLHGTVDTFVFDLEMVSATNPVDRPLLQSNSSGPDSDAYKKKIWLPLSVYEAHRNLLAGTQAFSPNDLLQLLALARVPTWYLDIRGCWVAASCDTKIGRFHSILHIVSHRLVSFCPAASLCMSALSARLYLGFITRQSTVSI